MLNGQRPSAGNIPSLSSVIDKYTQFLTSEGRAKKTLGKYDSIFRRLKELASQRHVTKITGVTLELVDADKNLRVADEAERRRSTPRSLSSASSLTTP